MTNFPGWIRQSQTTLPIRCRVTGSRFYSLSRRLSIECKQKDKDTCVQEKVSQCSKYPPNARPIVGVSYLQESFQSRERCNIWSQRTSWQALSRRAPRGTLKDGMGSCLYTQPSYHTCSFFLEHWTTLALQKRIVTRCQKNTEGLFMSVGETEDIEDSAMERTSGCIACRILTVLRCHEQSPRAECTAKSIGGNHPERVLGVRLEVPHFKA